MVPGRVPVSLWEGHDQGVGRHPRSELTVSLTSSYQRTGFKIDDVLEATYNVDMQLTRDSNAFAQGPRWFVVVKLLSSCCLLVFLQRLAFPNQPLTDVAPTPAESRAALAFNQLR
jgi:hypothetical protein